ncbi:hypothetical protein PtA15_11A676 [Puccinia triticina]|uniref:Myb/SANT-like domain-containing protein n=1 Tax=Puccinia triticina TaxID=208348 RepID=A0ABY7CXF5_9BASI|nr:uncharacterized protein PtA15_11A676 [Puccinia triticina]WAQ89984.1 hypothetical protein PtA15_11A676 [Puccinia triticina]
MAGGPSQARLKSPEIEVVSGPARKSVEKRKHSPTPTQTAKPAKAAKKTTKAQQPKPTPQWSASEDATLISILEGIQANRSCPMNRIDKSVWPEAAEEFNSYDTDHPMDKDAAACKARFNELKKMYRTFKRLKNMSGGGWHEGSKRVIFDPAWWDEWDKDDPILAFRYKGFPIFEDMFHLVERDPAYR